MQTLSDRLAAQIRRPRLTQCSLICLCWRFAAEVVPAVSQWYKRATVTSSDDETRRAVQLARWRESTCQSSLTHQSNGSGPTLSITIQCSPPSHSTEWQRCFLFFFASPHAKLSIVWYWYYMDYNAAIIRLSVRHTLALLTYAVHNHKNIANVSYRQIAPS